MGTGNIDTANDRSPGDRPVFDFATGAQRDVMLSYCIQLRSALEVW
jgi:hypothetical protein